MLVIDEGHRLKNADCKLNAELRCYNTKSKLLLTGKAQVSCTSPCCRKG